MFVLSKSELIELTGYRQKNKMFNWLKANGIAHYVGGDGWPKVIRHGEVAPKTLTRSKPNVAALKELQRGKTKDTQERPA